jgi:D-beta-D-heptose 7-phosphate kinase/D-beta-D-heptose 1-phosphate adenosyltransferase
VQLDANEIERQAAMPALQHPKLPRLTYQPSGAGDWFAAFLAYSSLHRPGCFVEHCHYAYRAAAAAGYFPPFRAPVLPREIEAIDRPERLKLLKNEEELLQWLKLRRQGRLVLTNGVFDLLHAGHVENLRQCRDLGEQLLVLVNGDRSAAAVKGRLPVMPLRDRMHLLTHLDCVSAVAAFHEDTPLSLLSMCQEEPTPAIDVYVKGDDTTLEEMARQVPAGYVENFALLTRTHHSTSSIRRHCEQTAG